MNCRFGLGNRLFYFSYCIALAQATGHTVLSSCLPEFGRDYGGQHGMFCFWPRTNRFSFPWPNTARRTFNLLYRETLFPLARGRIPGVKVIHARLDDPQAIALGNPDFLQAVRNHRLVIMTGWPALESLVILDPDEVRAFFRPRKAILDEAQLVADQARGASDILIGIHCRWGDYRNYGQGRFYFPVEAYLRVMRHCAELFPGQSVSFLVVTNEREKILEREAELRPFRWKLGPGDTMVDLHALAACNYIVSPASSYSLWAAFWGRKPMWCMTDAQTLPRAEDFVLYNGIFAGAHPEGETHVEPAPWA